MSSDLPFAKGKRTGNLLTALTQEPDPLEGVVYTGDLEVDAAAELSALQSAFRSRRTQEDMRRRDATDSEFWVALCFKTRAQKDEFLKSVAQGGPLSGDKYLNGIEFARRLGIPIGGE